MGMGYSRFVLHAGIVLSAFFYGHSNAQRSRPAAKAAVLVYVDKQGVLRWVKDHREAAFFGVNYTVPFAYSYRAHQALHVDPEQAMRQDVYHLARLGVDAFRVHVWDTEISDSLGNLLSNEHLRLFDFLLAELEKRGIKAIITPIAFWGNGYPERDEMTPGFSRVFGKGKATSNDTAIRAQENYLDQLFRHINPYTKLSYGEDPNVIAVELNNEPSHSGPPAGVTAYINRLASAMRATGWAKPLYYNISQSPYYAAAVAGAAIDGVSFQWYPSGLVGGADLKGNFLPNVDRYVIPYDTIAAFRNKSRMVYEFDAADMLQSDMYPAMARSFREAGFQWATQFAYDPMALAYANTEYQTHYLNLAYTPSKAISLLIASRVFHRVPRLRHYGGYPADSVFDAFRVSYRCSLSEMNSAQEFYYSNSTASQPLDARRLEHVAGVGSSAVVQYAGTGVYFLDRIGEGIWRLEVMPDAISIRNPFARPAPDREATRIQWASEPIRVILADLGRDFLIRGLNEGNHFIGAAAGDSFGVRPGTYLVMKKDAGLGTMMAGVSMPGKAGELGMNEFVAPQAFSNEPFVAHEPFAEVSEGLGFFICARIVGLDSMDKVTVMMNRYGGFRQGGQIAMVRQAGYDYTAEIPAAWVMPGELNYRILIRRTNGDFISFPGNHTGNPFAWDNTNEEEWRTFVAARHARLEIFNPGVDRAWVIPAFRRGFQVSYVTGEEPGRLIIRLVNKPVGGVRSDEPLIGLQYSFAGKMRGRESEAADFDELVIRARTVRAPEGEGGQGGQGGPDGKLARGKITLTDEDAFSYSARFALGDTFQDIAFPLSSLVADSSLLMPRPYPGFQPLWFKAAGAGGMGTGGMGAGGLAGMEKVQVILEEGGSLEVESIWLQKSK
jgi:hypothetical protein